MVLIQECVTHAGGNEMSCFSSSQTGVLDGVSGRRIVYFCYTFLFNSCLFFFFFFFFRFSFN